MEIKIKKEIFLRALSFTQNIVDRKTTKPILLNVLLETKEKRIRVSATDLEVGISIDCPADVLNPGSVTVLARGLFEIIKELSDDMVHMKVLSNQWLSITSGRSKFKIVGAGAENFPSIPVNTEGSVSVEDRDRLLDMIRKTSYAMSTDETRYNLNGICLQMVREKGAETLRMVATDGHRLAVIEREAKSTWDIGKGVIIPYKGVMELKKLLDAYEGDFSFRMDEKNMTVMKENAELVIRLIDGQFPPYEHVIPKGVNRMVTIDREEFIMALRRESLMSNDNTRGVKMLFSPGHIELSAHNPDFGEAKEELMATYKGETFTIGFNSRYFIEVLSILDDERVVLELGDDVSPCLIRSEYDKGLTNVIMPMRI